MQVNNAGTFRVVVTNGFQTVVSSNATLTVNTAPLAPVFTQTPPTNLFAYLGQPSSYANRFVTRHGTVGNLTFVDGHAEALKGNRVVETTTGSPNRGKAILPQSSIVWTPDPTATP